MTSLEITNEALRGLLNGHQEREEQVQTQLIELRKKLADQADLITDLANDLQKSDGMIDDLAEKLDNANSLNEEYKNNLIPQDNRLFQAVQGERDRVLEILGIRNTEILDLRAEVRELKKELSHSTSDDDKSLQHCPKCDEWHR